MNDLLTPILDPSVFGCVSPNGYGYSKRSSTYRVPALKGRPRYRLKDTRAVYEVNVTFSWTQEQFSAWQDFYANEINFGESYFIIALMLDDAAVYANGVEQYLAHMIAPYSAALSSWDNWEVTFTVEIPGGFRTNLFECPTLYGGPINALAPDDIYGGPIDALAEDVIEPCPGVDPNG